LTSNWKELTLFESMEKIIDYRGKTPPKKSSGVPLITAKIVKNGKILPATEFISLEDYDGWMSRGLPLKGDVLITTEAPLGEVAQISHPKVALAQRLILLRSNEEILSNDFLLYLLQSPIIQYRINARGTGTTVIGIKQSELKKVILTIPPLEIQKNITKVLISIDKSIKILNSLNACSTSMAKALFKSWFIDFDPVKAKAEGRQPIGMDEETAALFPDSFEDSPLGPIPAGWKVGSLSDISSLKNYIINTKKTPTKLFNHYSIPAFDKGKTSVLTIGDDIESGKYRINSGMVLISKLNPNWNRVWLIGNIESSCSVCSTEFQPIMPLQNEHQSFIYLLAISQPFRYQLQSRVTGTSGSHKRVKPDDMMAIPIVVPPMEILEEINKIVSPMLAMEMKNIDKTGFLNEMKDSLLPRLMSGELSVEGLED
jgi:type I restriction enzyme, S subunit